MPGRERSIPKSRSTRSENRGQGPILAFLLALPFAAAAEDLLQVYRDAQRYDAVYSGARYALEAGREKLPQGRALLLPTVNLTGSATKSRIDGNSSNEDVTPSFVRTPSA